MKKKIKKKIKKVIFINPVLSDCDLMENYMEI